MTSNLRKIFVLLMLALFIADAYGQKKAVNKSSHPQQKNSHSAKPAGSGQNTKKTAVTKDHSRETITNFTPEQVEGFRQQSTQLVKFFEGTLNFLADKRNTVKEKEVIITESYLKSFWDSKVQVEDDLDEKRLVSLYKDIPAYLTDVDFFFKRATFRYDVQDVSVLTNEFGQTYFRVTTNRSLAARTVNNDTVNSNKVRYFEINYDDNSQQLKIASIYTTKLNESTDLQNWWNGLPDYWRSVFGKDLKVDETVTLAQVTQVADSVITVNGAKTPIAPRQLFSLLTQVVNQKQVNVSGNTAVVSLEPLGKLSSLVSLDISNTPVSDLMPLRNLNAIENLDISGTPVQSLEPLRYANHLHSLKMKKLQVRNIGIVSGFPLLEVLDITDTPADSLDPVKELTQLKDLRISGTGISRLESLSGLENLEMLYLTGTKVSDLTPLKNSKLLRIIFLENTKVSDLGPLENLPQLRKIFCDQAPVPGDKAIKFMLDHPQVLVIFKTEALNKWWAGMSQEWKKVFNLYSMVDALPTSEQLHRLVVIDSINVKGRPGISSLAPLMELEQLRYLDFGSTSVDDLGSLKNLRNISYINASNTKITEVEALKDLDKLTEIVADNTLISELMPLAGLKKLKMVFGDNTGITLENASRFADANPECLVIFQTFENNGWWNNLSDPWKEEFRKQLNITGTPDKVQLQMIANLVKLNITEDPQINSLIPVLKLQRLKELQFSGTTVASLSPISGMHGLQVLRCPKNPVTDLTTISGLTSLKELDFSNTQVEDLLPIQNMRALETLRFSGTPVKSLKVLQFLPQLQILEFYNTKVSNIDALEQFRDLKSLKIFNTRISEKRVEKFKLTHPSCEVVFY